MQLPSIFTLLAVGLSFVAAEEDTTTSTSTMTKTVTITQCNPSVTNCPGQNTSIASYPVSSSVYITPSYPVSNSSSIAYPTAYPNSTTYPTMSNPVLTETTVVVPTGTPTPAPTTVPASGAGGLLVQSGLLLGVLGAGVALLA